MRIADFGMRNTAKATAQTGPQVCGFAVEDSAIRNPKSAMR